MSRTDRFTIVYDGRCGFCCALVARVRGRDRRRRLAFVPFQDEEALEPTGVSRAEAAQEVYLVAPDGRRWSNGEAVARTIALLPAGRLLGKVMQLPLARGLVRLGYRLVARNRTAVSRLIGLRSEDGCAELAGR